jgi:hypothetical protein
MTRELDFPVFDGDHHLYETRDALTAYLPAECNPFWEDNIREVTEYLSLDHLLMKVDA